MIQFFACNLLNVPIPCSTDNPHFPTLNPMQNIEYKAELRDFELARSIAKALGARFEGTLEQADTYFRVADARFKKREAPGTPTQYILYKRPDRTRPKISQYDVFTEEEARVRFGEAGMKAWVVVKKTREVYLLGNVRIHLDSVERLGNFLEFEAIVSRAHNVAACHAAISRLCREFLTSLGEPISCGYLELMTSRLEE
ncbi:MAG: class IV adenylate cyclase [Pyrinomonadaceae bacterium]|nr:class IV adenylate cyclase [Phycisphaerales bacterium]